MQLTGFSSQQAADVKETAEETTIDFQQVLNRVDALGMKFQWPSQLPAFGLAVFLSMNTSR